MAPSGPNRNGCQFMVCLDQCEAFDSNSVAFGRVVSGLLVRLGLCGSRAFFTICIRCPAGVLLACCSLGGGFLLYGDVRSCSKGSFVVVPRTVPLQGQCRTRRVHVVAHGCCPSPAARVHALLTRCLIVLLGTSRRTLCACMLPSVGMPRPSWTAGCCRHRTVHPSCPHPASPGLLLPPPLCTGRRNLRPWRVRSCTGC
jgi:cyclophilin family peptidyl-prolyl cis-trans isomerase